MTISRSLPFVLLGFATPALADDAQPTPAPAPGFAHLGPDGRSSEIAADLTIMIPTADGADGHLLHVQLEGQGVDPKTGLGGYASLGFMTFSGDGESESVLGGIELGGLYHVKSTDEVDATFRLGVVLPNVREDNEDAFLYTIGTAIHDPSNLVTGAPESTSLRFAATPTYHRDQVYARGDVGIDVILTGESTDAGPFVHADFAVGLAPRPIGGAVELQTLCTVDSDETGDRCLELAALSVQAAVGKRGVASVGLSHPFGSDDDDFNDFVNLEAGFRGRF